MIPSPRTDPVRHDRLGGLAEGDDRAVLVATRLAHERRARIRVEEDLRPLGDPLEHAIEDRAWPRSRGRRRPSAAISSARRRISSYSRAFWIAVPTLAAIVDSRRSSASPKRPASLVLWTLITPIDGLAGHDRDAEVRPRRDADRRGSRARSKSLVAVEQQRLARGQDPRCEPLAEGERTLVRVRAALPSSTGSRSGRRSASSRATYAMSASNASRARSPTSSIRVATSSWLAARRPDLVDRRELGRTLARLLDEAGVLEGDAEAGREGREQPDVVRRRTRPGGRGSGATARPRRRSPTMSGTKSADSGGSPTITGGLPYSGAWRAEVCRRGGVAAVSKTCLRNPIERDRRLGQSRAALDACTGSG